MNSVALLIGKPGLAGGATGAAPVLLSSSGPRNQLNILFSIVRKYCEQFPLAPLLAFWLGFPRA